MKSFIKALMSGGKQKTYGTGAINKVEPNVPKTKLEKTKRDLKLATQKSKASQAKLDNTIFRIEQQKKRLKDMQTKKRNEGSQKLFEASKGRKEFKFGSKKKSNIQKIKETFSPKKSEAKKSTKFGMLSVKAGIDKNPNPTLADRIAGAKMKNKKGMA